MKKTHKILDFIKFIIKNRIALVQIITAILFLFFLTIFLPIVIRGEGGWSSAWSVIEPLLGGLTITIASFIWLNEKIEDWEESMPKRLEVEYLLDSHVYVRVHNAPLTSEDDIRQWGQSIAQTLLNDTYKIRFTGFYITELPKRKIGNGKLVRCYKIQFYLTQKIDNLPNDSYVLNFEDNGKLIKG